MSVKDQLVAEKRRRRKDQESHQASIRAKNKRIADLEALWEFRGTFPNFFELVGLLREAYEETRPLQSYSGDRPSSERPPPHLSTKAARRRVDEMNRELDRITAKFAEWLGGRSEPTIDLSPVCWNPQCADRGLPQPFARLEENKGPGTCQTCGAKYGTYKQDLPRCFTRSCPHRNSKGNCMHSWLGVA